MEKINKLFRLIFTALWVILGLSTLAIVVFLLKGASWQAFVIPGIALFIVWICFKRLPFVHHALLQQAYIEEKHTKEDE